MVDLTPTSVRTLRGALVVGYGDRIEVVSGGTTTIVFFVTTRPSEAAIVHAVRALRPLAIAAGAPGHYPRRGCARATWPARTRRSGARWRRCTPRRARRRAAGADSGADYAARA